MKMMKHGCPNEDHEQTRFVTWLEKNGIIHHAIPNGGRRTVLEGVRLRRLGLRKGVPDMFIPFPAAPYHGLYIEIKPIRGGVLSEEQKVWLERLNKLGYRAVRCNGADECIAETMRYLGWETESVA